MKAGKLLVSVRSAAEATLVLQGGASIIDIKEPSRGPLGRADAQTIADIAQVVQAAEAALGAQDELADSRQTMLSVAMGELAELEQLNDSQKSAYLPAGDWYLKIGLAGEATADHWRDRLTTMFACFPQARPVPVAYWDAASVNAPSPEDVLDWAMTHHAAAFLIDTADKAGQGLFQNERDLPELKRLLAKAHEHDLPVAVAGRLVGATFDIAADLARQPHGPAIVGVRTAACHEHQRDGVICPQAVAALLERLGTADVHAANPTNSVGR